MILRDTEKGGDEEVSKRILVVESERGMRELISTYLMRAGYEVVGADNGTRALELTGVNQSDLIVLAVMLDGDMDGFEVLQSLQANPATADIPVIVLTAKAQDADIFRGWQSGISAYLVKPFSPRELLTFIERIFRSMNERLT